MSFDARGFHYVLEPLLRRQRWQVEALQARLGVANRKVADARQELDERQARLREQHARAADAAVQRMDPALHRANLHWLAQLREEIAGMQRRLDALREERAQLLAQYVAGQNKLAVIEKHREECLAEYAQLDRGRAATAADRDWLARKPGGSPGQAVRLATQKEGRV